MAGHERLARALVLALAHRGLARLALGPAPLRLRAWRSPSRGGANRPPSPTLWPPGHRWWTGCRPCSERSTPWLRRRGCGPWWWVRLVRGPRLGRAAPQVPPRTGFNSAAKMLKAGRGRWASAARARGVHDGGAAGRARAGTLLGQNCVRLSQICPKCVSFPAQQERRAGRAQARGWPGAVPSSGRTGTHLRQSKPYAILPQVRQFFRRGGGAAVQPQRLR